MSFKISPWDDLYTIVQMIIIPWMFRITRPKSSVFSLQIALMLKLANQPDHKQYFKHFADFLAE